MPTNPHFPRPQRGHSSLATFAVLWLAVVPTVAIAGAPQDHNGEQLYRQQCASCHGPAGEGTAEHYPRPLLGNRSVAQLTRLIEMTMPEEDPDECVGENAEKVAAYIHDAFYSRIAQARNRPARIDLSRLTVRQYRNAVTDLLGTFREPVQWDDDRGLRGEYFNSRRFDNNSRAIERRDAEVRFDFGEESPDSETMKDSEQFSIRWQGSVLAPETGLYDFIVHTEHATQLWVNDNENALIDAWVKSGDDTEHRGLIFLLGGRVYPLRLEFSKAKQGVDDSAKNKPPKVPASISLHWQLPKRTEEVIPERNLSPHQAPETFVLETPFPPDDRSVGYERGTSVSKEWTQATTDAAIEVANYITAPGRLDRLAGVRAPGDGGPRGGGRGNRGPNQGNPEPASAESDREAKLREFALRFVERAFRRPLTDEQKDLYIDRQFQDAENLEMAVKRVVLLTLKSPRFLYREINDNGLDAYVVASRISFGLWDSLPDRELLEAARADKLSNREQVARQAERMLDDLRTRSKLREFFLQWLQVENNPDLAKDPEVFPEFDKAIASDLRTSLDLLLEEVVWDEKSDFRQILLADRLYLNGRLAQFYDTKLDEDAPFQPVALDPEERAGALTHPYLMAHFAYASTTSPIHRGVFLARNVLGEALRPPPEAFSPLAPDLHPDLTNRERVALQTSPESCMTCHQTINPLGFSLEHFDAVGRYRTEEKGQPIDASGTYQAKGGDTVSFNGARDFATFLAKSDEVHTAFVEQLFHSLIKQPIRAHGPQTLPDLRRAFAEQDLHIRKLAVEIVTTSALATPEGETLASARASE